MPLGSEPRHRGLAFLQVGYEAHRNGVGEDGGGSDDQRRSQRSETMMVGGSRLCL